MILCGKAKWLFIASCLCGRMYSIITDILLVDVSERKEFFSRIQGKVSKARNNIMF